jgi:extracellular elastinolytic metalloproteinase
MSAPVRVVFFDLGDTLGTPELSADKRLVGFKVFDFARPILGELQSKGLVLGIISNTGNEDGVALDKVLETAGILRFFNVRVYSKDVGLKKDSPEIFTKAAALANVDVRECVFVGEDSTERSFASSAGMRACPHPLLVSEVLAEQALQFVRLVVPPARAGEAWQPVLRSEPVVPLHVSGKKGTTVYAITSVRTLPKLINFGFGTELLGGAGLPERADLYLMRDDAARSSGFLAPQGEAQRFFQKDTPARLVGTADDGLLVAIPQGRSPGEYHFAQARHGHTLKLLPQPRLLAPRAKHAARRASLLDSTALPPLSPKQREQLGEIKPGKIAERVKRYSGLNAGSGQIASRHIAHSDNAKAVQALVQELEAVGKGRIRVRQKPFTHRGLSLANVEGELAGASSELVLITAHLDSTAASSPPYHESSDPAPGADDDASGIAAVLSIAEWFASQAETPARTLRFVLFNAEEEGLVGSQVYARDLRDSDAPVVAVFQMDMIGYNKQPPRSWEVHAGFEASDEIETASVVLASLLKRVTPLVSPELDVPQIYRTSAPGGDPAAGHSDHSSFHSAGYAACCASEDFFAGPGPGAPEPEGNPDWHHATDEFVDEAFAADIARVVAAAALATVKAGVSLQSDSSDAADGEASMAISRELDTRRTDRRSLASDSPASRLAAPGSGPPRAAASASDAVPTNALTGSPVVVAAAAQPVAQGSLIDRAVAFLRSERTSFGFAAQDPVEFVPDPVVQRTSSGSAAVHLHQYFRGIPLFQMTRTVRFDPDSRVMDAVGDNMPIANGFSTEPSVSVNDAVRAAAKHLAATAAGETRDQFGQKHAVPGLDIDGFQPETVSSFSLSSRPTVLAKGPFENAIPAHLAIFLHPHGPRLVWHVVLTLPEYMDQYVLLVAADQATPLILYCKSTLIRAAAQGRVFEFSPGIADRRMIPFPRPLSEYPVTASTPLTGFPRDWVTAGETLGDSTRATLNSSAQTLKGTENNGVVVFDPSDPSGDDQKLLNIFYFCNYLHDFLFILGFDEAAGNFQTINVTNTGLGGDPVRARAHSGPVFGTANMSTGRDGLPPLMNMGLVSSANRHTAFDADVVFHEYVHGLTQRLAGGPMDNDSLSSLQGAGMGEGWGDYFALSIQNFLRDQEKVVIGDWVVNNSGGIRRAPYDDDYPFTYADLAGLSDEHDVGEVWCAALMMMTRRLRAALGSDQDGYRLAWRIVVDGLKLMPAEPTFLQARDAMARALDDLRAVGRITVAVHERARRAFWEAFAHFGMGINAFSDNPDDVSTIVADKTLPGDL